MEICQNLTRPSLFTLLTVFLTLGALGGVILNIKKKKSCFYIWLVTNTAWAAVDFYKGIPAQGVLFSIYAVLAVWGIFEWKEEGKEND
jgi:nicotinamide riboside transporter PnuC